MMMIMVVVMVVGSEPQSGYLQKKTKAPILSKHFFDNQEEKPGCVRCMS